MSLPPPEPPPSEAAPSQETAAPGEMVEQVSNLLESGKLETCPTTSDGLSVVDLPDELLPAPVEEKWLPLPGKAGMAIEHLARAALGDLVPPEPPLDFNLLDDLSPHAADDQGAEDKGPAPPSCQETATAAEAAAQLLPAKPSHIEVTCPNCSTAGLVPWDRLDAVLCCSGCWTWFRTGSDGGKTVVDPPAASQGALRLYSRKAPQEPEKERRAAQRRSFPVCFRIGPILQALVPLLLLGVLIYFGMRWWSKPRLVKLPAALDQRAYLWAESWLKYDTQSMVRMSHPDCRGLTRWWVHEHRPPLPPGKFDRRKAAIDVRFLHRDENSAEAEVRVSLSGAAKPIVWRQQWECLNGTWVFKPADEPVPARPPKPMSYQTPHANSP